MYFLLTSSLAFLCSNKICIKQEEHSTSPKPNNVIKGKHHPDTLPLNSGSTLSLRFQICCNYGVTLDFGHSRKSEFVNVRNVKQENILNFISKWTSDSYGTGILSLSHQLSNMKVCMSVDYLKLKIKVDRPWSIFKLKYYRIEQIGWNA